MFEYNVAKPGDQQHSAMLPSHCVHESRLGMKALLLVGKSASVPQLHVSPKDRQRRLFTTLPPKVFRSKRVGRISKELHHLHFLKHSAIKTTGQSRGQLEKIPLTIVECKEIASLAEGCTILQ